MSDIFARVESDPDWLATPEGKNALRELVERFRNDRAKFEAAAENRGKRKKTPAKPADPDDMSFMDETA